MQGVGGNAGRATHSFQFGTAAHPLFQNNLQGELLLDFAETAGRRKSQRSGGDFGSSRR